MIRSVLNSAVQKKFFVMFFTCVIYILGLCAYFTDSGLIMATILLILGVFAILKNYLSPKLILFWYLAFFFAFFNASFRIKESDILYQIAPQNATLEGRISSIPSNGFEDKTKFFFDVKKISYSGKNQDIQAKTLVNIFSKDGDFSEFNIGDSYKISGKLRTPFEVTNPSQFDYGRYLRNFDTFSVFYANKPNCTLENETLPLKWKFLQGLSNIRNDIIKTHSQYLKSPNLELLGGMVFGDDAVSPPEYLKKSFANSGLLHLLAASGMNVALIYGIWFFILRKLKVPFNISVSSGIFVIIFYALMTGLGPSVIRAAFMLIFILIGKLIDRDAHSISLLSFVALLMLIYNPAYINDVGFQLSFLVTFGLLIGTPIVVERTKFMPAWLSGAIFIPIIAQIWVAPIQMFYFNSFSLYSVFANIIILPFVTIVSFGGFVSAVLALIKPMANLVCLSFDIILNPVLNVIVFISDYFSNLPHSLIQTSKPEIYQIILYYAIVLFVTLLLKFGQNKKIFFATIFSLILLCLSLFHIPNQKLETIVFDVQNADAFLIKTPQDRYFIIDSAKMGYKGGKNQAKMIILKYLKDKGIKNIEGLIISHFDSDHAGGATDLIDSLNIKNVYVNSLNDKSKLAQEIYGLKNKTHLNLVQNNSIIYKEKNLTIKNFNANLKGVDFENENSIITLVSYKDFDQLFMGDAGTYAFEKIKKDLPDKIEILKVGHHGAKNVVNKAVLDRIKPEYAIISTGINNYGHPNGVTLDILKSKKVKTLRTDRQNAIKIENKINAKGFYNVYSFNRKNWVKIN